MKSILKLSPSFPIAGFSYFTKKFQKKKAQEKWRPAEYDELPAALKKFVEANDLVVSYLHSEYMKIAPPEHFLDGAIIKDLKGFHYFEVFVEKELEDVLTRDKIVPQEEKDRLNGKAKLFIAFSPTKSIEKQKGIAHSAVIFTLVDNMFGDLAFIACDVKPCITAYLNSQYLKPLQTDKDYVAVLEVDKVQGSKVFVKGKVIDFEGNVYMTSDCLFVKHGTYLKCTIFNKLIEERQAKRRNGELATDKGTNKIEGGEK